MKNIKRVLAVCFAVLAMNATQAQDKKGEEKQLSKINGCGKGEIGIIVLPGFSSFTMKTKAGETANNINSSGYGFGAVIGYNMNDYTGAKLNIIYDAISKKYVDGSLKREVEMKYVDIPLLFSLSTNKSIPVSFDIAAGPQISFNAGSNTTVTGGYENDTLKGVLSVRQTNMAIAYGAGLSFAFSRLQEVHVNIGFRGSYGLTTINDSNNELNKGSYNILDNTRLNTYSGYVGLCFKF